MKRVIHCPPAPPYVDTHSSDVPRRTDEEKQYLRLIAENVIQQLHTLPYDGVVEVRGLQPNPMRTVEYNNSGVRRDPRQNYQCNNDLTYLRTLIRSTWRKLHPEDWLAIDWPQDDRGSRRLMFNADGKTIHYTIGRNKR